MKEGKEKLKNLLAKAEEIAREARKELNKKQCPTLDKLFVKVKQEARTVLSRNDVSFDLLLHNSPNRKNSEKRKSNNEIKGLYIFGECSGKKVKPVYVGISRSIYSRLRQHGFGKQHNQCSLAYLIGHNKLSEEKLNDLKTKMEEKGDRSLRNFFPSDLLDDAKRHVRDYHVYICPVEADFDLYFLEVAIAGLLKTEWNSFRTH